MARGNDDHSLVVDDDGSRACGCVVSLEVDVLFSASWTMIFSEDGPSSTSISCARGENVTQQVQKCVMRPMSDGLRLRCEGLLPSLLVGVDDMVASASSLRVFRRVRFLTGIVSVEVTQLLFPGLVHELFSFSFSFVVSSVSAVVDWCVIDVSVWFATGLDAIRCDGEGVSDRGWDSL